MCRAAAQSFHDARAHVLQAFEERVSNKHVAAEVAKAIERSVMDYTKQECKARKIVELRWSNVLVRRTYLRKFRMILNNWESLMRLVKNKDIALCEFAFVDHQRMRPDIYKPILDLMEKREKFTLLVDATEDEDYQSVLKCDSCGSFRTTYVTMQTRSADEPETIYMKCFNCGKNDTIRG
jgi:DNA-directed RNA polymerase subunit M/transcription elongation factor TFIIS